MFHRIAHVAAVAGLIAIAGSAGAASRYSVTDLGTFPGGRTFAEGHDINDAGEIVGVAGVAPANQSTNRAFLWNRVSGSSYLGSLPGRGSEYSVAVGINNRGWVVGRSGPIGSEHGFIWDDAVGMLDVGDLPGGDDVSRARAVNSLGKVVGRSDAETGPRAFVWEFTSGMQDIGDLPGGSDFSEATAINEDSEVVGASGAETGTRAFIWSDGSGMRDIGDLPGGLDYSAATDINDAGQVVGESGAAGGIRGFVWSAAAGIRDLGVLPGGSSSIARAINAGGMVVGSSRGTEGRRAVLWDSTGGIFDINSLIDPRDPHAGVVFDDAYGINAAGQIITNDGGRVYLLTPMEGSNVSESTGFDIFEMLPAILAGQRRSRSEADQPQS